MYEATRLSDNKEFTVLFFDKRTAERPHKPRRKELVVEVLRKGYANLFQVQMNCSFNKANQNNVRVQNTQITSKFLQIVHKLEETADTLSFAVEPLFGSLANITGYLQHRVIRQNIPATLREYSFLEFEVKYGLLQLSEALMHLHHDLKSIHRNICPQVILINKKGTFKLSGLEFAEKCDSNDYLKPIPAIPFTNKLPKITQSDLNFSAPECELNKCASPKSDLFSLGLVFLSLFNDGFSPLNCDLDPNVYAKKLESLTELLTNLRPRLNQLSEPIQNLLERDFRRRPTIQEFISKNKYFNDPGVHALQYLDIIQSKENREHRNTFYQSLNGCMHTIPKKMWFQHLLPSIATEFNEREILGSALDPILHLISESSQQEYEQAIYSYIKPIFTMAKTNQATIGILENIEVFLEKSTENDFKNELLPIVLNAFDSKNPEIQISALESISIVITFYNESHLKKMLIQRLKQLIQQQPDVNVQEKVILCIDKIHDKLDKADIADDVLPLLSKCNLSNPTVLMSVTKLYKQLLECPSICPSVDCIATNILPNLIPATVNHNLTLEQFQFVSEILQNMLILAVTNQRTKISTDNKQRIPNLPIEMASSGKLSSSLNHLINTYNSQLQNNEINNNQQTKTPIIQQPFIACTAPALDNSLNNSLNEMSAKVANIKLNTTDTNNNTTSTPLVIVGGSSPISGSRRKSSTTSYTNLTTTNSNSATIIRPTNLNTRSTESSPEQQTNPTQSINSNNLLTVNTSGMKSRRHSDNAINVPKIEVVASSPTTTENKSISRAASSSNLSGRRFSSISPEDLANFQDSRKKANFQANRKERKKSTIDLDLNFNNLNKRRHSSINPNDIKSMANKVSRAADNLVISTTEKIVDSTKCPSLSLGLAGLDFPSGLKAPKRNRRSSVAAFLGQNSILPSVGGSNSSSKLLQKFSGKKTQKSSQTTSQKLFDSMNFLKPK